jgi:autotransporter-associated beta strand protein
VNQTGGTVSFTASDALLVGNGTGCSGTYNLSGGALTSFASAARGVMLGVNSDNSATFNLSGTGNLSIPSAILMVGRSDSAVTGCTALFNQTGGTATVGTLTLGGTGAGTANATLTLSAGTFVANTFTKLAIATNDVAVINIGGTADVTLPAFPTARGAGATTTLNFDGGTLKPKAASATYLGGLTNAFIKAGGARIDTTGFDITITQNLLAHGSSLNGGLTKVGTNKLTLNGTNTYTGDTTISGGTLALGTINANNEASTVTIADTGATLQLSYVGTDTVNKLFVGTTQLAAGVYGKSGSVSPIISLPQIIGDGTLTVTSGPANGFATWITGTFANGTVPSGQQGPNDDPDNDGIRNLVEFAIAGQDPTVSNPSIGSFNGTLLSFTKREGTSGLSYAIQNSTDLGLSDAWAEVPAGPSYTNNATTISYTLTPGSPAKNFIRLSVTSAP